MGKQYRLVTRSDMDGLVCAVLLKELNLIDEIRFVHPKDMQDGLIEITHNDITTNLPYVDGVYLAFDHHLSETLRNEKKENHIIYPDAPSASRVVYDYYGGKERFPERFDLMMQAVDKADAAQFNLDDVLEPQGWELLSFLMDARTGLGRFRDFRISNYQLMMDLISYCKDHTIEEILQLPDVQERSQLYFHYANEFKEQLIRCSRVVNNIVVLDLRHEEIIYPGNRFMIYALNPICNLSIHVLWGLRQQNTVFAVGKSIFNKTSTVNIGELMLSYGGGGHQAAGTCQVDNMQSDSILTQLISQMSH